MSTLTLSSLAYISRDTLAATFTPAIPTNPHRAPPPTTAIIDVRDSDHVGGHIRGSTWVPSSSLDARLPELLRTLADKETVVFHCALSQQRGPGAALRYLREKERVRGARVVGEGEVLEGEHRQSVYVLRGGFSEWQEKYGRDEALTEGYRRDVWEWGS